ncbi:unnamed protein product [Schistosoma margrebowiei]|uniref:Zinc finger HIT domain-containing protein 3 n=2 Tax=Schistosoma margrebowiei TaxID=48269 RepID=A0A183MNH2_9TREM|nr:unnamed protein product [Schistosoma margrebowiei]
MFFSNTQLSALVSLLHESYIIETKYLLEKISGTAQKLSVAEDVTLTFNEMVLCAICSIETSKYKCPRCIAPYCSLACYQKHKQDECKPENCVPRVVHATVEQEDEMVDYVPKKILEGLKYSDKIRDLLKNPHLRSLLRFLNDTNKPYSALENVMREPIFVEFSDECLKIVGSNL